MVQHPEKYFENYQKAGACKVIFHYEATNDTEMVINKARKLNLNVGLAVNPETPVSRLLPVLNKVDGVLLLSVHPGYYGAKFIPEVVDKISELRKLIPDIEIGIDGEIKENNVSLISKSGIDEIFVGSAIFLQQDPGSSYQKLLALANP
jgi:ribulose-phosphate 3-epimerase